MVSVKQAKTSLIVVGRKYHDGGHFLLLILAVYTASCRGDTALRGERILEYFPGCNRSPAPLFPVQETAPLPRKLTMLAYGLNSRILGTLQALAIRPSSDLIRLNDAFAARYDCLTATGAERFYG